MKLEVGDEITCPSCDRVMLKCLENPTGLVDYAKCFESVEWKGVAGNYPTCSFCGAWWAQSGLGVHVKGKGYVS